MKDIIDGINGSNGWIVALIIVLIVFSAIILVKNGILRIHTKKFSVSSSNESERATIRHQIEMAHLTCMAFEEKIPKDFDGYDYYRSKYILELVYDEIISWIMFNHIDTSERYVSLKQNIVWKLVLSNTYSEKMRSKKFQKEVFDGIKDLIDNLVLIRQQYEEEGEK